MEELMPEVFGKQYDPDELRSMVGSMAQVAGVRMLEMADGKARGMRVAEVYTGSGFSFQVYIDRAMDIGAAAHAGRPLAWVHPALGGPDQHEPEGYGWARTFGGGLVTTCGLTFFGHPEEDGEMLGLHGRISHISAGKVNVREEWRGEDYVIEIEGQTRQAVLGGENLLLIRKISTSLGANSLVIEDTVRNDGFVETPHMLLYHCNFGFPVVSPDSELLISDDTVRARDYRAEKGFEEHTRFQNPEPGFPEQVFFHKPKVDTEGFSQAAIVNRAMEFGGFVRYRVKELPFFAQWKLMDGGNYVCGLEPANQWETPRKTLREEGRLKMMQPGEEIRYRVELGALPHADAIRAFEGRQPR
jgi:hypothetical protein